MCCDWNVKDYVNEKKGECLYVYIFYKMCERMGKW